MVKAVDPLTSNRSAKELRSLRLLWALLEDDSCICAQIYPTDRPCATCEAASALLEAYRQDVLTAESEKKSWSAVRWSSSGPIAQTRAEAGVRVWARAAAAAREQAQELADLIARNKKEAARRG